MCAFTCVYQLTAAAAAALVPSLESLALAAASAQERARKHVCMRECNLTNIAHAHTCPPKCSHTCISGHTRTNARLNTKTNYCPQTHTCTVHTIAELGTYTNAIIQQGKPVTTLGTCCLLNHTTIASTAWPSSVMRRMKSGWSTWTRGEHAVMMAMCAHTHKCVMVSMHARTHTCNSCNATLRAREPMPPGISSL